MPHARANISRFDRDEFYRASLRALSPCCRPPSLQPPLPPPLLYLQPPLPLDAPRDWIDVPNSPVTDEDDGWPALGANPVVARASAASGAGASSINKRDVARLARVCGGRVWSFATPPVRSHYWKPWDPTESPNSVVSTI